MGLTHSPAVRPRCVVASLVETCKLNGVNP
jgi:hypothetical protein